ncbi:hypothetical protein PEC302107_22310 [Pectobacterium araliae]|nr:hypothetical protein PEC302107_22310 [Pectobacterium carotovorum subsp. carotovorum]
MKKIKKPRLTGWIAHCFLKRVLVCFSNKVMNLCHVDVSGSGRPSHRICRGNVTTDTDCVSRLHRRSDGAVICDIFLLLCFLSPRFLTLRSVLTLSPEPHRRIAVM